MNERLSMNSETVEPPVARRPLEPLVMPLSFGSLFAGIGGFDLGFERAGMVCKWQVEIDEYANRVLAKNWPDVRRWPDVRTWPQPDTERVDVICGGFPCQDISPAGNRKGIDGERSGLFFDLARVVRELRPTVVVLENSSALVGNGLGRVLGELSASGFDAEWTVLPAAALGAPHERARTFVVAYAESLRRRTWWTRGLTDRAARIPDSARWDAADAAYQEQDAGRDEQNRSEVVGGDVVESCWRAGWPDEPALLGVDDGVPHRVDRTRCVGNAVSPIVAEWIGRRIVEAVESAA